MATASNRRRSLDAIIDEAMNRCNQRQKASAAPVCSKLPPAHHLGVQRGGAQLDSTSQLEETVPREHERRRLPVISRSQLNSMTNTGPSVDHEAARTLLTVKIDGNAVWERSCLINQERTLAAQEVYLEALGLQARRHRIPAIRKRPPAAPGRRSILAVSSTRSHSLDPAARRHANFQRRKRHGRPATISFGASPFVHHVGVHPGNRLHGLPAGAIRSSKHQPRCSGLGAL
jgi:hypothetical protein